MKRVIITLICIFFSSYAFAAGGTFTFKLQNGTNSSIKMYTQHWALVQNRTETNGIAQDNAITLESGRYSGGYTGNWQSTSPDNWNIGMRKSSGGAWYSVMNKKCSVEQSDLDNGGPVIIKITGSDGDYEAYILMPSSSSCSTSLSDT